MSESPPERIWATTSDFIVAKTGRWYADRDDAPGLTEYFRVARETGDQERPCGCKLKGYEVVYECVYHTARDKRIEALERERDEALSRAETYRDEAANWHEQWEGMCGERNYAQERADGLEAALNYLKDEVICDRCTRRYESMVEEASLGEKDE